MEITRLKELCLKMKAQRETVAAIEAQKKEAQAELEEMQGEILEHLKQADLKNFDFGEGKIILAHKFNVSVADKYQLAEHLKGIGRFDDLFTFNYQTINSYYKEQLEAAKERGDLDLKIDGLTEPKLYEYIQLRSKWNE